jgi:Mn-dependent DtxR family transcriptional regulator
MLHSVIQTPPHDSQVHSGSLALPGQRSAAFSPADLKIRSLILKMVMRRGPTSIPDMCKRHPNLDRQQVSQVFSKMTKAGDLHRAAHGIYIRPGERLPSSEDIQAIRQKHSKPRKRRDLSMMEFLKTARTSVELQTQFSVSRQRIDQKTKVLMKEGSLHRKQIGGVWHYAVSMDALEQAQESHTIGLESTEAKIINALPRSGPVAGTSLSKHLDISWSAVRARLPDLQQSNLVEVRIVAGAPMVEITSEGRRHPCRKADAQRLTKSDFRDCFGAARSDILKIVDRMGPLQAQDIRYCLEAMDRTYKGVHVPQILSRMRTDALLVEIEVEGCARCAHGVGPAAAEFIGWVRGHVRVPSKQRLHKAIVDGHARTQELRLKKAMASRHSKTR